MGFLGGVLKGAFKFVAPIAANFIGGPLASAATKLLTGVADKFIGQGKGVIDGLLQKLPFGLGKPVQSLVDNLIGKLQGKVDGGIESFISKIAQSIVSRLTGDGKTVTPPALGDKGRTETSTAAGSQVINNLQNGNLGTRPVGGSSPDSILSEVSLPGKPGFPGANATDEQLLQYQEQMQKYNRMLTMITQLLQMQHEGKKSVVQNLRA